MAEAMILRRGGGSGEAIRLLTLGSAAALPASAPENTLALVTAVTPGTVRLSHTAPMPMRMVIWQR